MRASTFVACSRRAHLASWNTEQHFGLPDPSPALCWEWETALQLAATINQQYVVSNQTSVQMWTPIYSWYVSVVVVAYHSFLDTHLLIDHSNAESLPLLACLQKENNAYELVLFSLETLHLHTELCTFELGMII